MPKRETPLDAELVAKINRSISSGKSFDTHLDTDERVLARITDGIYRQPASALRELIANAYDADATIVSITTDAPRFNSIKVSDNGAGMGPEALANMVLHIGGSAKRTQRGPRIGVTSNEDPTRSKRGRRLIGKIGIGLFSVAQLTRQFTIVTKMADTNYQLLAHVTLNRPDEAAELSKVGGQGKHVFRAGEARIWAEKTADKKGQGTTIHLMTLLPRVVHILQSRDVWAAIRDEKQNGGRVTRLPPLFHIGQIDPDNPNTLLAEPQFPWNETAGESARFHQLVAGVADAYENGNLYGRLEHALDNYFQMIWTLGLSVPIPYVEKHPFNLTGGDIPHFFLLPDRRSSTPLPSIKPGPKEAIGKKAKLPDTEDYALDFAVNIDSIRLARPIRFHGYPQTVQAFNDQVMFVGKATPDLSRIPEGQRGGPLSFAGYFFWTPRLIPREHNGLLVRINGASGTLFDSTFLQYPAAEVQLGHIVAEVFVHTGLQGALNVDWESFNTAHPHYQTLANWVHNSLRLIRNTLQALQSEARKERRAKKTPLSTTALAAVLDDIIQNATDCDPNELPEVVLAANEDELKQAIKQGKIGYLRNEVFKTRAHADTASAPWIETHVSAVARLLEAFGLLKELDRSEQGQLVAGIVSLFRGGRWPVS